MAAGIIKSRILSDALLAHGGSNREIAEEAGVSFRGLAEARKGFDVEQLRSPRKQYGVAESMTRLSIYLGAEPEEVLEEIGVDPTDPSVRRHIDRGRADAAPQTLTEDHVLQTIRIRAQSAGRESGRGVLGPVVGLVRWKPFFDSLEEPSMGVRFTRSLLGSLNADWNRRENLRPCDDFQMAEEELLAEEDGRSDVVMGLYDLPWRRGGGVDVVRLPGLAVRLGGLGTREFGWRDLLLADRPGARPPSALVIQGDAGSHLLRGPVVYPSGQLLEPLTTFHPPAIAERVRLELTREHVDGFVFVADGPLVSRVRAKLSESGVDRLFDLDHDMAPSYRFGLGVRADAPRFKALVEEAFAQDLFDRVLAKTVDLYIEFLAKDADQRLSLDLSDLERLRLDLPARFLSFASRVASGAGGRGVVEVRGILARAGADEALLEKHYDTRGTGEA